MKISRKIFLKQHVFALLFFLSLALIFTYPAIEKLNTNIIGDGGDNWEYFSYMHLVNNKITHLEYPFSYSTVYRYPAGFDFGLGSDARLFVFIGGIFMSVLEDVTTFNLLILLILTLNGYISFVFFTSLTNSSRLGLIGGVIYGFSYYVLARGAGHINLLQIYPFSLAAYSFLQLVHRNKINTFNIFLFTFSPLLILLASKQYLLIFSLFSILFAIFYLLFFLEKFIAFIKSIKLLDITKFAIFAVIFISSAVLLYSSDIHFFLFNKVELSSLIENHTSYQFTTPWIDFIYPNSHLNILILDFFGKILNFPLRNKSIETALFVGFVELFLFILFIFSFRKSKKNSFVILFTIFFWFACSSFKLGSLSNIPYDWVKNIFPFVLITEHQRFFVIFYLFMTTGIVLFLKKFQNQKSSNVFLLLIIILLSLERINLNYFSTDTTGLIKTNYQKFISKLNGAAVLDLPILTDSRYDILPFYYKKNIVNGYFYPLGENVSNGFIVWNSDLSQFKCDFESSSNNLSIKEIVVKYFFPLRNKGVRIIVVHKDILREDACYQARISTLFLFRDINPENLGFIDKRDLDNIKNLEYAEIKFKKLYEDNQVVVYLL